MNTRRHFLGTLGKAFGAGGLLLPLAGKGALALPVDLGKAAQLPLAPAAIPLSSQFLRHREVWRELHHIYLSEEDYSGLPPADAWRDVMRNRCSPLRDQIVGRKNPSWQDCREIAEICLFRLHRQGPHDRGDPLCALVYAVLSAGGVTETFVPEVGTFALEEETCL